MMYRSLGQLMIPAGPIPQQDAIDAAGIIPYSPGVPTAVYQADSAASPLFTPPPVYSFVGQPMQTPLVPQAPAPQPSPGPKAPPLSQELETWLNKGSNKLYLAAAATFLVVVLASKKRRR